MAPGKTGLVEGEAMKTYRATIPHSSYYTLVRAIRDREKNPPTFWQEAREVLHAFARGVLFGNWGD